MKSSQIVENCKEKREENILHRLNKQSKNILIQNAAVNEKIYLRKKLRIANGSCTTIYRYGTRQSTICTIMASHYTFDYIFHERISQTTLPTWLFVVDPAQVQGELDETLK